MAFLSVDTLEPVYAMVLSPHDQALEEQQRTPYKDLSGQISHLEKFNFETGAFSDVYKGKLIDTEQIVVLKIVRGVHTKKESLETMTRRLYRESYSWHKLSHRNVLPFFGIETSKKDLPSPALVSPFYANGDAVNYLKVHPHKDRFHILRGIACGLAYLHGENMIHADMKGNNVLIDDSGEPRIADFGRARLIDQRGYTTALIAGSVQFVAPELHGELDAECLPVFTKKTDVYGFAMCALQVFSGELPFPKQLQDWTVVVKTKRGDRPDRSKFTSPSVPEALWKVFEVCWQQDADSRPEMTAVVDMLMTIQN
ncbi:hypothetical protein PLICRDRAFT_52143 [Plicaturopsis crispa FD-325 SS-3]|nr:hypothetical protein PLICRDRAFT_52143 [Plicaturopsis crispa FD-325 SS-3]